MSPSLEVSGGIIEATVSEGTELEHPFSFLQTRTELLRGGLACPVRVADIFASSSPHIGRERW